MALNFETLEPTPGTGLTTRRSGREAEYNPFLEKGWLWASYESSQDFEVTVDGGWEEATRVRGKNIGEAYNKLIGDAATVVRMLRDAADKQNIGVAIECVPALNSRKKEIPGKVTVKYLGKVRKQYQDKEDETGTESNGDAGDSGAEIE